MSKQGTVSRKASRPSTPQTRSEASKPRLENGESDFKELNPGADGYDADAGPLESGYASRSVTLPRPTDRSEVVEPGLSIDPEDLGRHFLEDAAQQEPAAIDPLESPELDEGNLRLDAEGTPFTRGDDSTTEDDELGNALDDDSATEDEVENATDDSVNEDDEDDDDDDDASDALSEPSGIDLTQDDLREGSLFEQPSGDDTRSPVLKTDELEATLDRNERARRFGNRGTR